MRQKEARGSLGRDQSVPDGDERQLGLIHHIELLLDVVEMRADGGGRELQVFGNLLHRGALTRAG